MTEDNKERYPLRVAIISGLVLLLGTALIYINEITSGRLMFYVFGTTMLAISGGLFTLAVSDIFGIRSPGDEIKRLRHYVKEHCGTHHAAWSDSHEISQSVSETLGSICRDNYEKHCRRICVTSASDIYTLAEVETLHWKGLESRLWSIEFEVSFDWLNDSKIAKRPFKDLTILTVAPQNSIPYFGDEDRQAIGHYTTVLRQYPNHILIPISNPFDDHKPVPKELSGKIFKLREIAFEKGETWKTLQPRVVKSARTRCNEEYGIYNIQGFNWNAGPTLEPGESLRVRYKGITKFSLGEDGGKIKGQLIYPPSDIVTTKYAVTFNHPKKITLDGKNYKISIDKDRTYIENIRDPWQFISDGGRRDDGVTLTKETPLTDMDKINLGWFGEQDSAS